MVKKGWLDRQIEQAQDDIKKWPEWMKREAELDRKDDKSKPSASHKGSSPRIKSKS